MGAFCWVVFGGFGGGERWSSGLKLSFFDDGMMCQERTGHLVCGSSLCWLRIEAFRQLYLEIMWSTVSVITNGDEMNTKSWFSVTSRGSNVQHLALTALEPETYNEPI